MAVDVKTQQTASRGASSLDWLAIHIATIGKVLLIVFLLAFPMVYSRTSDSNYAINVMSQAGLYAIVTMAVGLVLGQAGQLSFGHSAFYGIGAYTCGLLILKFHVNTFAAWVAGRGYPVALVECRFGPDNADLILRALERALAEGGPPGR